MAFKPLRRPALEMRVNVVRKHFTDPVLKMTGA